MATGKVTPIRNPWDEVDGLDRRIGEVIDAIPGGEMGIGYQLSPETQQDMRKAAEQLRGALQLLQRVEAREVPLFEAFAAAHYASDG